MWICAVYTAGLKYLVKSFWKGICRVRYHAPFIYWTVSRKIPQSSTLTWRGPNHSCFLLGRRTFLKILYLEGLTSCSLLYIEENSSNYCTWKGPHQTPYYIWKKSSNYHTWTQWTGPQNATYFYPNDTRSWINLGT